MPRRQPTQLEVRAAKAAPSSQRMNGSANLTIGQSSKLANESNRLRTRNERGTFMLGIQRKSGTTVQAQNATDLARTDQRNMDSGTRKAMQRFYYRQNRVANGLNGG